MYDSNLRRVVSEFSEKVLKQASSDCWHFDLPSTELLVDVDVDGVSCSYYFVNHEDTLISWLDNISTDELGIPSASGSDHLRELIKPRLSVQQVIAYPKNFRYTHPRKLLATSRIFPFSPRGIGAT